MADLDAIVKQLEAERDRIDSAIKALRGLDSTSGGQPKRRTMRSGPSAHCRSSTGTLGKSKRSEGCPNQSRQASHLSSRPCSDRSGSTGKVGEDQEGTIKCRITELSRAAQW